ncbi:MAG: EAL domain-containing protein [Lachnospiraceae bacterium]|nr:EAL domain-containing protein [Lachnospiraceae bacterium]
MEHFRETSGHKRRVLIVDDEMVNREILGNILSGKYDVSYAGDGQEALELIKGEKPGFSLVLLDLIMPRMDGFELIKLMRADNEMRSIPVIVMTAEADAEVKSINLGAADFITKPYDMPEVIIARCERIIEFSEDKTIISSAEKDNLTGLYSRDFFFEYIRQIEEFNNDTRMDAVVFNIDHFHLINEMYGRKTGDKVLKGLADILMNIFEDVAGIGCRAEADRYYVYCQHQYSYDNIMQKIQDNLPELSEKAKIRVRMGIYPNVEKDIEVEAWFDRAKVACDRIRGDYTKSMTMYSSELHEISRYHEELINEIDEAIENRDLIVFYQPKYGIQGDKPVLKSAEALIRWKHPRRGMISPGDFIPLFESNGLIQKLDNYTWEEVAHQIRRWREKYGRVIPVSVNVSRIDIYDPALEKKLMKLVEDCNLTTKDIMLEITESAYSDNQDTLVRVVENLRNRGFKIEMDDFGSGYSSLNMLTTIAIDVIKIDMKFIRNMLKDDKSLRMVKLIMDIAGFLEVPVVTEGVEEKAQVDKLREMGCDLIQGYYFSKPVPPEDFEKLIDKEMQG